MTFARCDNRFVARCLETMRDLVLARGGFVHPAAWIEEQDGSITVHCAQASDPDHPLVRVPDELLVPTDELCWTDSETAMELASEPTDYDADRREMLDLFIAIYNASDKLGWLNAQAARVLLRDTDLAAQLSLVRPGFRLESPTPSAALIETRYYASKHAQAGMAGRHCIMPLIDFINHRSDGAPYRHAEGFLTVGINRTAGTHECFTDYGKFRDPLGLALGHGYLAPESPYAQSLPAAIDLAGFGRFEITGKRVVSPHRADLPKVEFTDDGLILSHLSGDLRSPAQIRATLHLALMASARRRGLGDAAADRALAELPEAILAANRERFAAFQAYLATRPDLPLASLLSQACALQYANLEEILRA